MPAKFYIKTFGCIQNTADSERIKAYYWDKGFEEVKNWKEASEVVINTCVIRESAENRAYGLINNIDKFRKSAKKTIRIIVTGCLTGVAHRDEKGKKMRLLQEKFPQVDEFKPTQELKPDSGPLRQKGMAALVVISSGCNNFCSYCIVPFARGREVSRPFEEILNEAKKAYTEGFREIVLIGQNVNSYGSDLVKSQDYQLPNGEKVAPVMVKSLNKTRVPTLFPYLLEEVAKIGFTKVSFVSSNPWDFSDKLIEVIAANKNIDRLIHLPFQAGDDDILNRMNRGYGQVEYLDLVAKIKSKVEGVRFSTDVIVGFPGESLEAFSKTVEVCRKVGFEIAYINKYSPRKGTVSAKIYSNDISPGEKKRRWQILNELVNTKQKNNSNKRK
jgi:tRNA-2-methylthio-N6-dimethylallyladenosine synthase